MGCAYLFSSFFEFELGSLVSHRWIRYRNRSSWSLIGSVAALLVNPVGIKQILYPFDTLMNMHFTMANVEEWSPLKLNEARGIGLMAIVFCCFLLPIARKAELFLDELLLLGMGTWLAVGHLRMLIVFGILAAPILSRQLAGFWENYDVEKDRMLPNAVLISLSLLIVFVAFPSRQNLESQVEAKSPVKAVAYMKDNHLAGPILNEYGFGGYLIWAAPEYPVMMDGRGDVYEWSGFMGEFGNWMGLQSDPNLMLNKYKVNLCLLSSTSPMVHVFPLLRGWKQVYSDNISVIFVRSGSQRFSLKHSSRYADCSPANRPLRDRSFASRGCSGNTNRSHARTRSAAPSDPCRRPFRRGKFAPPSFRSASSSPRCHRLRSRPRDRMT